MMGVIQISDWTRIVEYPQNHLNDFCIFKALDGRWHALGIMGTGTWESETSLFHCSCDTLMGQYEIHEPLLTELEQGASENEHPQKHAPFVVVDEGLHHMFFRRPWGTNLRVTSEDGFTWSNVPDVVFEERDARDACIRRFEDGWYWYYVQRYAVGGVDRSCVMLRTSHDLKTWSEGRPAYVDSEHAVGHSRLESPTVVAAAGGYWLFVRDRQLEDDAHPAPTIARYAESPDGFTSEGPPLAVFPDMHAPELVEDDGRLYIVRVSGVPHAAPAAPADHGWLEIAELTLCP